MKTKQRRAGRGNHGPGRTARKIEAILSSSTVSDETKQAVAEKLLAAAAAMGITLAHPSLAHAAALQTRFALFRAPDTPETAAANMLWIDLHILAAGVEIPAAHPAEAEDAAPAEVVSMAAWLDSRRGLPHVEKGGAG
jgi:hypothetical protein